MTDNPKLLSQGIYRGYILTIEETRSALRGMSYLRIQVKIDRRKHPFWVNWYPDAKFKVGDRVEFEIRHETSYRGKVYMRGIRLKQIPKPRRRKKASEPGLP